MEQLLTYNKRTVSYQMINAALGVKLGNHRNHLKNYERYQNKVSYKSIHRLQLSMK